MRSTSPLSPPLPSHGLMTMAFSGCRAECSALVSSIITLDRSRFRYDRSCVDQPLLQAAGERKEGRDSP